ncbi:Uncharacterized protein TCM_033468 [Theobroma cacao]|uniref:Uncharacterized protein n=1 Tax=Theobroma cacao TaxID=3641 RepID=A0A061FBE1_THECC|nr:Uncharacterized protein TCM_033468 [Theobroma cacao]
MCTLSCMRANFSYDILGLTNLKSLQISCSKVTDFGITYLKDFHISSGILNFCPVTTGYLEFDKLFNFLHVVMCWVQEPDC